MTPSTRTTTCPLDCPDACKLEVQLEGDRVVKIDGAADDPATKGFICGKVRGFADHVYSGERVLTPLRRLGEKGQGQFEPFSWNEAYDAIAERLLEDRQNFGGESILPLCYGGSNGRLTQSCLDARFFHRIGASRLDRTVCAAPSGAAFGALYGKMPGVAYADYVDTDLIVIWGNNPHASGIHLTPFVQQAHRNGAKLVVVDPRRTPMAAQADLHLPVYPGADLVIALAMIHWLFENGHADQAFLAEHTNGHESLRQRAAEWPLSRAAATARVSEPDLRQLFTWYAEAPKSVVRCGWGPERNRNGGSATAAILAIPAIANKFGPGSGFTMSNSGAWQSIDASRVINAPAPNTRRVNMNVLGRALLELDPPIRSLFVYNCNPVATLPEQNKVRQGMQRSDLFSVVFDQVMTDTAQFADIVLPATTFLEHQDLRNGYGYARMGQVSPMIPPVGEAKPNNEVFAELLRRTNLEQPEDVVDNDTLVREMLGESRYEQLQSAGEILPESGLRPVQMKDVMPLTPSGKIELFPQHLEDMSKSGLYVYIEDSTDEHAKYPLALLSPSTSKTVNSTLGQLLESQAVLSMHPEDATPRGLANGDTAKVFNDLGEVEIEVKLDDAISRGVVSIPKGIWLRHTRNGQTANALTPDTLSDIGAGACFNDARVQVAVL